MRSWLKSRYYCSAEECAIVQTSKDEYVNNGKQFGSNFGSWYSLVHSRQRMWRYGCSTGTSVSVIRLWYYVLPALMLYVLVFVTSLCWHVEQIPCSRRRRRVRRRFIGECSHRVLRVCSWQRREILVLYWSPRNFCHKNHFARDQASFVREATRENLPWAGQNRRPDLWTPVWYVCGC